MKNIPALYRPATQPPEKPAAAAAAVVPLAKVRRAYAAHVVRTKRQPSDDSFARQFRRHFPRAFWTLLGVKVEGHAAQCKLVFPAMLQAPVAEERRAPATARERVLIARIVELQRKLAAATATRPAPDGADLMYM